MNTHEKGIGYKRKPYVKVSEKFSPKRIILNAVKDKLQGTGITRMVLVFNIQNDCYNVMLRNTDGKSLKLDIEEKEINMIKKMFVNRIVRKYNEDSDREVKAVIVEINLELDVDDALRVFIQDIQDRVQKFDF